MNDTPVSSMQGSTIEELQRQVCSLRMFFTATLVVLVLLSFALNIFIFRQVSMATKQLKENQQFVDEYNKVSVPLITDFLTKLTSVSKTNADVARLLTKYNIQQATAKLGASAPANSSLTPATSLPDTGPGK